MNNGQIPLSQLFEVEGCYFDEDTAQRIHWAISEIRARGGWIRLTEGYRPLGVPADRYVTDASKTSTGGSNQWYQKGREDRGLTPSAATPGYSIHGWGRAVDADFTPRSLVVDVFRQVGLIFTISNEPWHAEANGPILVPAWSQIAASNPNKGEKKVTYGIRNKVQVGALPGLPKDAVLIGEGTDPLVWVSNPGPEMENGVTIVDWSDKQIKERIAQVGLRGSGRDINKVFSSLADAQALPPRPAYTL